MVHDRHLLVARRHLVGDLARAVTTAIIDDHDLKGLSHVTEYVHCALGKARKRGFVVVDRKKKGNSGLLKVFGHKPYPRRTKFMTGVSLP